MFGYTARCRFAGTLFFWQNLNNQPNAVYPKLRKNQITRIAKKGNQWAAALRKLIQDIEGLNIF